MNKNYKKINKRPLWKSKKFIKRPGCLFEALRYYNVTDLKSFIISTSTFNQLSNKSAIFLQVTDKYSDTWNTNKKRLVVHSIITAYCSPIHSFFETLNCESIGTKRCLKLVKSLGRLIPIGVEAFIPQFYWLSLYYSKQLNCLNKFSSYLIGLRPIPLQKNWNEFNFSEFWRAEESIVKTIVVLLRAEHSV